MPCDRFRLWKRCCSYLICLDWLLNRVLLFLGFLFDVVAGAVMLRMCRCGSLSSLRLCGVYAVGGLRTCMPAVGLVFVRLVLLGVAFLALSAPLLCSSLSLSLSASASGKQANLIAPIWGGHLVLMDTYSTESSSYEGFLGYML